MSADAASIAAAFAHCREITRRRARNFHYGIRLSPEPQRSAIHAVYAWMRLADDLVDSGDITHADAIVQRVQDFRAATDDALAGRPRDDDPLWLALSVTAERFNLPSEHFHLMLDGQLDDARRACYDTYEQLAEYCGRVASTVGLICIQIWGYSDAEAPHLAAERGVAFQLTNILRDVAEDHDAGRVYLPAEDFARAGITPGDLRAWRNPEACRAVIDATIRRAQATYDRSAALDMMVDPCGRPTLWAMTSIYQGLLLKIKRDPARVALGRRVRLSALRKCSIAVRAGWLARFMHAPAAAPAKPRAAAHAKASV